MYVHVRMRELPLRKTTCVHVGVCMYVCMCEKKPLRKTTCVHVCVYAYGYVYAYREEACMYVCVPLRKTTCVHVGVCVCVHVCMQCRRATCSSHTHVHMCMHVHACACMRMHVHACACITCSSSSPRRAKCERTLARLCPVDGRVGLMNRWPCCKKKRKESIVSLVTCSTSTGKEDCIFMSAPYSRRCQRSLGSIERRRSASHRGRKRAASSGDGAPPPVSPEKVSQQTTRRVRSFLTRSTARIRMHAPPFAHPVSMRSPGTPSATIVSTQAWMLSSLRRPIIESVFIEMSSPSTRSRKLKRRANVGRGLPAALDRVMTDW